MNKYETIIIFADDISEKEREKVLEKVKTLIKNNGEILEVYDVGIKNLVYEIKKHKRGYYFRMIFKLEPKMIFELERLYRITDEIMKFITIKIEN